MFFVWSSCHFFNLCRRERRKFDLTTMSSHPIIPRYPIQILCLVCVSEGMHEARIVLLAKLCKKSACLKEIPQTLSFAPKCYIKIILKTKLLVKRLFTKLASSVTLCVTLFPFLSYQLIFSHSLLHIFQLPAHSSLLEHFQFKAITVWQNAVFVFFRLGMCNISLTLVCWLCGLLFQWTF